MTRDLLPDRQELIQQLFADITRALEVARASALTGQSHGLSLAEYGQCAKRLQAATGDIATLSVAIGVVLCPASEHCDGSA